MDAKILADSPLPTAKGLLADLLWALVAPRPQGISGHGDQRSSDRVPRWRLAREGPFLAERSTAALSSFGAGYAFRNTSYRASDYASPSGEFGIPLNHPVAAGCLPDDGEFRHSGPVCALTAGYGVENAGKEPRSEAS